MHRTRITGDTLLPKVNAIACRKHHANAPQKEQWRRSFRVWVATWRQDTGAPLTTRHRRTWSMCHTMAMCRLCSPQGHHDNRRSGGGGKAPFAASLVGYFIEESTFVDSAWPVDVTLYLSDQRGSSEQWQLQNSQSQLYLNYVCIIPKLNRLISFLSNS